MNSLEIGTHTIFVGKVIDAEIISDDEPMTYKYYQDIKGGKAPKTAPTYMKEDIQKEVGKMQKYKCSVCGYVVMYMIPNMGNLILVFSLVHPLKNYQTLGFGLSVGLRSRSLKRWGNKSR